MLDTEQSYLDVCHLVELGGGELDPRGRVHQVVVRVQGGGHVRANRLPDAAARPFLCPAHRCRIRPSLEARLG